MYNKIATTLHIYKFKFETRKYYNSKIFNLNVGIRTVLKFIESTSD